MKLYVAPKFDTRENGDGGIRRVIEAIEKYMPNYGWTLTENPYEADVLNCHAGTFCDMSINKPWVTSNHGLYWNGEISFGAWSYEANADVIKNLKRSDKIIVPSDWVAQSIRRGMCRSSVIIPHGVNLEEFEPGTNEGYVLWNKARTDEVSNSADLDKLASLSKNIPYVSTFGNPAINVRLIGRVPYQEMKKFIKNAGVYLCTARETFGIGTLEAMACGVPIVGWDFGGQTDIVTHHENGYLVPPGDFDGLLDGVRYCLSNRKRLGENARSAVEEKYQWHQIMPLYHNTFNEAALCTEPSVKVSVIITHHNLEKYLFACLRTIVRQDMSNWECIVVDDDSDDDGRKCEEVVKSFNDARIKVIHNEVNQYLAESRNVGIRNSVGKYILPLDADDGLEPYSLRILSDNLDAHWDYDIVYGHMRVEYEKDGRMEVGSWPKQFKMEQQMQGKNQLPYASMFRRKVWETVGGYRKHIRTAEDADFWCRVTSYGFRPMKVVEEPCLIKGERDTSMSRVEPVSRDWREWFPWAYHRELVPFGSLLPSTSNDRTSWPVRSHDRPLVSVIIPVGYGHEQSLVKSIDSVVAQTFINWEIIVVNDTDNDLPLSGFPFVKYLKTGKVCSGAGAARNIGTRYAKGKFLVFLDADDWLESSFIEHCLGVIQSESEYVYTDANLVRGSSIQLYDAGDISCKEHLEKGRHAITCLIPKSKFLPFDEKMQGWEDWDFLIALVNNGCCPVHLPEALVNYDIFGGRRRDDAAMNKNIWLDYVMAKWKDYIEGRKQLGCHSCGGSRRKYIPPPGPASENKEERPANPDYIYVRYKLDGPSVTYRGPETGLRYRFGNPSHKVRPVNKLDLQFFLDRYNEFELDS